MWGNDCRRTRGECEQEQQCDDAGGEIARHSVRSWWAVKSGKVQRREAAGFSRRSWQRMVPNDRALVLLPVLASLSGSAEDEFETGDEQDCGKSEVERAWGGAATAEIGTDQSAEARGGGEQSQ